MDTFCVLVSRGGLQPSRIAIIKAEHKTSACRFLPLTGVWLGLRSMSIAFPLLNLCLLPLYQNVIRNSDKEGSFERSEKNPEVEQ